MTKYIFLKKHCLEITEDLNEYENVVFEPEELNLRALMKYKAKTKKLLDYFDTVWGSYKAYCVEKGGSVERRCKVLEKLYILQKTMKYVDIAELFNVDESTIRRDEKKATSELSVFLFGVDALEDLVDAIFMP
ncbi:hypothetical protein RV18_GL001975 [Enterococcus termitis]|nr:hypothetical protein RV18_GL001975 [Enterococcus termitis]